MADCLHGVPSAAPANKDAGLQNLPKQVWDDTLQVGSLIFKFLGAPREALRSEKGQILAAAMETTDQNYRIDFAQTTKKYAPILKKLDERGAFLVKGEKLADKFDPVFGTVMKNAWRGITKIEDVPESARGEVMALTGELVSRMNQNPELVKDLIAKGISDPTTMKVRQTYRIGDDLMTPLLKSIDPKNPNFADYDLISVVPRKIAVKMLTEKDPAAYGAMEWLRVAMPKLVRGDHFNPLVATLGDNLTELPKLEGEYVKRMIDRIAGKQTSMARLVDGVADRVKEIFTGAPFVASPSARFSMAVTHAFYNGLLGGNVSAATLNLTQTINTATKFGLKETMGGLGNFLSKEGRMLASEREFLSDLHEGWAINAPGMFDKVGYWLFDRAEFINRGLAFHTGLSKFMRENGIRDLKEFMALSGQPAFHKGMLAGMDAANETQFLYGVVHQSPYLGTPLAKLIGGQFLTFPLRQSEFLVRGIREEGKAFGLRYLAYTGMAGSLLYYGAGLGMGERVGGAAAIPIALNLANEGKMKEAIWTGTGGLFRTIPGPYELGQGLTPFGSLMVDVLGLFTKDDKDVAFADLGRSMRTLVPMGLALGRAAEAGQAQFFEEGKRFEQGSKFSGKLASAAEGAAIPVVLNKVFQEMFGQAVPGIPTGFTGDLRVKETGKELSLEALGFRTSEAAILSHRLSSARGEIAQGRDFRGEMARGAAMALEQGSPEQFTQIMQQAMQSGLFSNSNDLRQAIGEQMKQRVFTKEQRQLQNSPKFFRRNQ